MAYEEKLRAPAKAHHVIMEERSKLSITGVEDVKEKIEQIFDKEE